jgi:hypothetical protein
VLEGIAGLLSDKTRKPGRPTLPVALVDCGRADATEPAGETHSTGPAIAAATGVSLRCAADLAGAPPAAAPGAARQTVPGPGLGRQAT